MQSKVFTLRPQSLALVTSLFRIALVVVIGLTTYSDLIAATDVPLRVGADVWVKGSFVNLRKTAQKDSPIVDGWPTNTRAKLLNREGDWCELENAQRRRGFMQCSFLAPKEITLLDLEGVPPNDAPRRRFWIDPSWGNLVLAGTAITDSLLSSRDQENELKSGQPKRWPVPEFEAMKARLRAGVSPKAPSAELSAPIKALPADALKGLPAGVLPKISRSFFSHRFDFALQPSVETVASIHGSTVKLMRVVRGPVADSNRFDDKWIMGVWDIGEAELSFEPSVVAYSIATNGMFSSKSISRAVVTHGPMPAGCGSVSYNQRSSTWSPLIEKNIDGYARFPDDQKLLTFYSSQTIRPLNVKVTTRQWGVPTKPEEKQGLSSAKLVVRGVDLNNDNVLDLIITERFMPGVISPFLKLTQIFANIGGVWSLEFEEMEDDCT